MDSRFYIVTLAFETVIIRIERKKAKEEGEEEGRERGRIFKLFLSKFRASRRRRYLTQVIVGFLD